MSQTRKVELFPETVLRRIDERDSWLESVMSGHPVARLAYSDWLEDRRRDNAARFWRWAAMVGFAPWDKTDVWLYRYPDWYLPFPRGQEVALGESCGDLPRSVFNGLSLGRPALSVKHSRVYSDLDNAWLDIMFHGADHFSGDLT